MRRLVKSCIAAAAAFSLTACETVETEEVEADFVSIFDGSSLSGWDGDRAYWRVNDGVIVGETSLDAPLEKNTFLIWKGGTPADFHLKLDFFLESGNSGVQYRSHLLPNSHQYRVGGYQADIAGKWLGILFGEAGSGGILARRGQNVELQLSDGKPTSLVTAEFASEDDLISQVDFGSWNTLEVIADGGDIRHIVNGTTFMIADDQGTGMGEDGGLIALQLHTGKPMKVMFRNISIKMLEPGQS